MNWADWRTFFLRDDRGHLPALSNRSVRYIFIESTHNLFMSHSGEDSRQKYVVISTFFDDVIQYYQIFTKVYRGPCLGGRMVVSSTHSRRKTQSNKRTLSVLYLYSIKCTLYCTISIDLYSISMYLQIFTVSILYLFIYLYSVCNVSIEQTYIVDQGQFNDFIMNIVTFRLFVGALNLIVYWYGHLRNV